MIVTFKSFGYMPDDKRNLIKDVIYRLVGYPHLMRRIQARTIFRLASSFKGKTVLDVGCGDGLFPIEYCRWGAEKVIGIDINEVAIKRGSIMIRKAGLDNRVVLIRSNAQNIPVKDDSFDLIISNCALEHMENDERVLKEISRCLKPSGIFILTVPYNSRRKILPIVDIMIRMPKWVQDIFAPAYLQGAHSYQEAIWKLKKERFNEVRNYSLDEIKKKLAGAKLELIWHENNVKFFAAMCWDLITGLKIFHFNRGMQLAFPVMYPISLLDNLLPKHWRGEEMALKAKRRA